MHLDFEFFQFTNTMCVRIGIKLCDQKGHMAVNSISTNGMHVCEARGGSGHTRTTQHRAAYQMDMYIVYRDRTNENECGIFWAIYRWSWRMRSQRTFSSDMQNQTSFGFWIIMHFSGGHVGHLPQLGVAAGVCTNNQLLLRPRSFSIWTFFFITFFSYIIIISHVLWWLRTIIIINMADLLWWKNRPQSCCEWIIQQNAIGMPSVQYYHFHFVVAHLIYFLH